MTRTGHDANIVLPTPARSLLAVLNPAVAHPD
jgi:hypothetical protein